MSDFGDDDAAADFDGVVMITADEARKKYAEMVAKSEREMHLHLQDWLRALESDVRIKFEEALATGKPKFTAARTFGSFTPPITSLVQAKHMRDHIGRRNCYQASYEDHQYDGVPFSALRFFIEVNMKKDA